jgi:hypothetical protein
LWVRVTFNFCRSGWSWPQQDAARDYRFSLTARSFRHTPGNLLTSVRNAEISIALLPYRFKVEDLSASPDVALTATLPSLEPSFHQLLWVKHWLARVVSCIGGRGGNALYTISERGGLQMSNCHVYHQRMNIPKISTGLTFSCMIRSMLSSV